ncbi:hypothetical protein PHSY_004540 [Pseudozyma hubeiensis SY62]|uniref:Uncharacterized protein n=1 Tax=Pseudozyma hubeiensis (strain SY62) TaxID=1305764 RepID=R9P6H2_PSEHS|nr:hypothetical protein PHSY_004540 [Pseudozyma hubeiensis SY62]GAC96956.1 hypothetical protein PHSY_004540 [Pseudozyma hubeiensis SY62]
MASTSPSTSVSDRSIGSLTNKSGPTIPSRTSFSEHECHNTVIGQKTTNPDSDSDSNSISFQRLRRRPFQRLPIPASQLFASAYGDSEDNDNHSSHPVDGEKDHSPTSYHAQLVSDDESFPRSPSNSPLSRLHAKKRSPRALYAALRSGFVRKRLARGRSASESYSNKQPRRQPREGLQLELEDLLLPRKKVAGRKPIPERLLRDFEHQDQAQGRSFSAPDVFSLSHLQDDSEAFLREGNSLGLYVPNDVELQHHHQDHTVGGTVAALTFGSSDLPEHISFDTSLLDSTPALASPSWPQQRLRRTTRSISESHHNRQRSSLARTLLLDAASAITSFTLGSSGSSSGDSDSDVSSQQYTRRFRTRSGSEPVYPSPSILEAANYTVAQPPPYLRRVSRKREGEMRTIYLSPHSPPTAFASSFRTSHPNLVHPSQRSSSLQQQDVSAASDNDPVEMLLTPDPDPSAYFQQMDSPTLPTHNHAPDSSRNKHSPQWDLNSISGSQNRNSEPSRASMLVMQQNIQMRNLQRQLSPPRADPHASPDRSPGRSRRREAEEAGKMYPTGEDETTSDTRMKAEESKEGGKINPIRQYGALRMRKWPSSEEVGGDHGLDRKQSNEKKRNEKAIGLRHMFSNPALAEEAKEGEELASLRQRRAKPPISIALHSNVHNQSTGSTIASNRNTRASADLMGAAIPLRKKLSKSILSPTASIHSPPPCPPPAVPLPDLPTPRSAPIEQTAPRSLNTQRSFVRCSSTPVSPFEASRTQSDAQAGARGTTNSQSFNVLGAVQPLATISASTSSASSGNAGEAWRYSATDSSSVRTPPLTGGMHLSAIERGQLPCTPLSAQTDASVPTPVTAQPAAVGGRFESLLASLSFKPRADEEARSSPRVDRKDSLGGDSEDSSAAVHEPFVYGLAL